jgi:hypothetical protein
MANNPDREPPGLPYPGDLPSEDVLAADQDFDEGFPSWNREPPSEEELYGLWPDPDTRPIDGWERLTHAEQRALLDAGRAVDGLAGASAAVRAGLAEAFGAGFTHRHGGHGTGFAAGGPLDAMLPGEELAWHVAAARRGGLARLSDYELCGLAHAARRLSSWQAELELAAITELDTRRTATAGPTAPDGRSAGPGGRAAGRGGEHVCDEVAALLRLTGRAAGDLVDLARQLARLPQTAALLAAGIIDRDRADVVAGELALLSDDDAAAVENKITPRAAEMTTGQLRARAHHAVLARDPAAGTRRRKKAEKDARVEVWAEPAGTAALAGRDLSPAGVITADKTLDADARWLRRHGTPGSHDQLRAAAYLARLTSQPLTSLIPAPAPVSPGTQGSGAPANTGAGGHVHATANGETTSTPASTGGPAGAGGQPSGTTGGPGSAGGPAGGGGLGGSVHLTMPATTWLGLTDTPGDIPGLGPVDAGTSRDLATTLAAHPATRWCITLTDPAGRAIAHGCARAGPGPPGRQDQRSWLAQVKITPIAAGTCGHRHESAGYQPSDTLRHLVKVRSPRCGFPGCRRPARRCDCDHSIPHHQGGRTCECNLYPLCRHHHQCKQAPGWHLAQPEPGVLVWTTPSGRSYTTTAEPYPL